VVGLGSYLYINQYLNTGTDSTWKEYLDKRGEIYFKYPEKWGDVFQYGKPFMLRIDTHMPEVCPDGTYNLTAKCKIDPDVEIFSQTGEGLLDQFVKNTNNSQYIIHPYIKKKIGNSNAIYSTEARPVFSDYKVGDTYLVIGYQKVVMVGLQKEDGKYISITFTSPTFDTRNEVLLYDVSNFDKFLSTIKFLK
jgi:hypothetical protein